MRAGEILFFNTDKVIGHETRHKYHVYLGPGGWLLPDHAFLFINKAPYADCYEIKKDDYPFLIYPTSYIACNALVSYSVDEIKAGNPEHKGRLSDAHLRELRLHVDKADALTILEIRFVCECFKEWA